MKFSVIFSEPINNVAICNIETGTCFRHGELLGIKTGSPYWTNGICYVSVLLLNGSKFNEAVLENTTAIVPVDRLEITARMP